MGLNEQGIMQTVCKLGRLLEWRTLKALLPDVTFSYSPPFQVPKWPRNALECIRVCCLHITCSNVLTSPTHTPPSLLRMAGY